VNLFLPFPTQQQQNRALLVYPPSVDFMVAFLGCLKAGIVAVPCFPPNPARKDTLLMFSRITESSGAQFALTSQEYNHLKKLAGVKDIFTKFTKSRHQTATWPEQLTWITTTDTNGTGSNKSHTSLPKPTETELAFLQVRFVWYEYYWLGPYNRIYNFYSCTPKSYELLFARHTTHSIQVDLHPSPKES